MVRHRVEAPNPYSRRKGYWKPRYIVPRTTMVFRGRYSYKRKMPRLEMKFVPACLCGRWYKQYARDWTRADYLEEHNQIIGRRY